MSPPPAPLLLLITGPSGAGKTTLGRRLAADLSLPFVHKDAIKERLHDRLGTEDLAASRRLGRASYDVLYYVAQTLLAARVSLVLESNFAREFASAEVRSLRERCPCRVAQIVCRADGRELFRRVAARHASGERHPAHRDAQAVATWGEGVVTGGDEPLDIGGETIFLDTTDFGSVDYDGLLARLRALLAGAAAGREADEER